MDFTAHEWHIISNPNTSSKNRKTDEDHLLDQFNSMKIPYAMHLSDGAGKGWTIAKELCESGIRHLMVFGGDGSINEVVNGIYESGVNPEEVFLAIVPFGTGNDFCRTLGYPQQPHEFLLFMDKAQFLPTDVGVVETIVDGEVVARRHFINIAGFAFDAAVIDETTKGKPKMFPAAVYLMKLVKVLFGYTCTPVHIITEEGEYSDEMFTIACGNAQYNGNGMRQVPMANPHDGKFDLVTIRKIRPMKVIANVKNLFAGKHITLPEVRVTRTRFVEIMADKPILGEVEGEMLRTGNYRIKVASKPLNVLGNFVEKN